MTDYKTITSNDSISILQLPTGNDSESMDVALMGIIHHQCLAKHEKNTSLLVSITFTHGGITYRVTRLSGILATVVSDFIHSYKAMVELDDISMFGEGNNE